MNLQEAKNLILQYPGQFYTYLLKRPDGSPFYVGKGNCKGFRIEAHGKEALRENNSYRCNIIRKIWEEGNQIDYEIVLFSVNEKVIFDKEIELIKLYGRKDNKTGILANLTDGGEGTSNPSEEARRKNSEFHKGKSPANKGQMLSEEGRKRLSEAHKNYSKDIREKMSKAHTGKPSPRKGQVNSEMHRKKISIANKGRCSGMKGKCHSADTKKKISDTKKGKIYILSQETRNKLSEAANKRWSKFKETSQCQF